MSKYIKNINLTLLMVFLSLGVYAQNIDSTSITLINGKAYFKHQIKKGQTALELTRIYNVDLNTLKSMNKDIDFNKLKKNQEILIPRNPIIQQKIPNDSIKKINDVHANAEEIKKEIPRIHIVSAGETIFKIATKYKISNQDLIKWNKLKNNKIEVSQELIISQLAVIKPYESWNKPNSSKTANYGSESALINQESLIEEFGYLQAMEEEYVALHKDLPEGALILVTNLENNKQTLIKITGNYHRKNSSNFILSLGNHYCSLLGVEKGLTRIQLKYASQ
jgi:LysM repeat protein